MNVRCWLFGHLEEDVTVGVTGCKRCDAIEAPYHEGTQWTDKERYGVMEPLRAAWARLCRRLYLPRRCKQCGKRVWWRCGYGADFCSQECFENWLPF